MVLTMGVHHTFDSALQGVIRRESNRMPNIFSTYSQGENRVTSTFLFLLWTLSVDEMQQLFGSLIEEPLGER